MKVVFVSNFMNHHQLPFSMEMVQNPEIEYKFIATDPIPEERTQMGYHDMNKMYDFIVCSYEGKEEYNKAIEFCNLADVVIFGSTHNEFIKTRLKNKKLTFKYSERIDKIKPSFLKLFFRNITVYLNNGRYKSFYLLSASAYAVADYAKAFSYSNKAYKWGYFPEVKRYDDIDDVIQNKKSNTLLWAGRFIDWKHPEAAIEIAKRLKQSGYQFTLNMIGTGYMEDELKNLIAEYGLEDFVKLLGSMPPEKVREHMENSQIFLFTSDRQEGWGAVLNESMNSGCAIIANSAIGSVPFLLNNNENGFIYKDGDIDDLFNKVKYLLDTSDVAKKFGNEAYKTLCNEWNAENAVNRLITLSKEILNGNKNPSIFENGVCSKAERLKDGFYNE